jgi:hypothetical protein
MLLYNFSITITTCWATTSHTNDYKYSTSQQAVLCAMVATTYLASEATVLCTSDLGTQLNWGKTEW